MAAYFSHLGTPTALGKEAAFVSNRLITLPKVAILGILGSWPHGIPLYLGYDLDVRSLGRSESMATSPPGAAVWREGSAKWPSPSGGGRRSLRSEEAMQ